MACSIWLVLLADADPKLKAAGDQRQHPAALPLPGERLFELPNEPDCKAALQASQPQPAGSSL